MAGNATLVNPEPLGHFERPAIAGCKQLLLRTIEVPRPPYRTHGVDHILRRQAVSFGCLCIPRLATIQRQALRLQPRGRLPGGLRHRHRRHVSKSRVDDSIHLQLRDVAKHCLEHDPPQAGRAPPNLLEHHRGPFACCNVFAIRWDNNVAIRSRRSGDVARSLPRDKFDGCVVECAG